MEGHSLVVEPEGRCRLDLELLQPLHDFHALAAQGLERRRETDAEVDEPHVAQALLAVGGPGAMPDDLVSRDSTAVADRKRVVGVFQHAAVGAAQDVLEVRPPVGPHPGHVGVEPRLPAAVAGAAGELHEQLARVGARLLQASREPGLAAEVAQVAAHPLQGERWTRDQEDGGDGLVHGVRDARPPLGCSRARPARGARG